MDTTTQKTVWHLFIEGDLNAFSTLFKEYYATLHNYGIKISGNSSLTEDCLQDFFVYLYENKGSIGKVNSINAYLFVSFRRAILKTIGKERMFTDYDSESGTVGKFEFSIEELIVEQEFIGLKKSVVILLLNELSPREREVIYLKYYSNIRTKDIADIMNITSQSVLNTLQKAFHKLRKVSENHKIKQVLKIN